MQIQHALTRRRFFHAIAGAAGLVATHGFAADVADDAVLVIDSHAHIYGEDESRYPPVDKPYRPPPGTGTISHLKRVMHQSGVRYVTAIQTSTFYRFDNRFTADSARDNREFMVGVVTLNPDDPGSAELLEKYVEDYSVRGMRSIPSTSGRLDDPGVDRLWATADRLGIVVNALVDRDKREEVERLSRRYPNLSIVIDHCLNLKAGPMFEPTLKDVLALAKLPRAHAKLSFVPTGSKASFPFRDMHDACRAIIDTFGPDRCVWGSDFPCELWCPNVSYAQHLNIFTRQLGLDEPTRTQILAKTAQRLWFGPQAG